MRIALCLILLASVCSAQVARRVQGDGLVLWFPFDATADRAQGIMPSWSANGPAPSLRGVVGSSGEFTVNRSALFGLGFGETNCTLAVWVYVSAAIPGNRFPSPISVGAVGAANGVALWIDGSTTPQVFALQVRQNSPLITLLPTSPLLTNQWVHLAGVVEQDGGAVTAKLFVNGALADTKSRAAFTYANDLVQLYVGRATDAATFFSYGLLDDARYYSRALSPQEIAALANSRRRNHSQ